MTDITNELRSLIESNIKPGEYMFADNFNLEDTLPAIDIGNLKMDRGLVKIDDEPLLNFVDSYFKALPNKRIDVSELVRNLFRLEMTWYTGRAFFNDTLLTCILVHRDPLHISCQSELAALAIEATMTVSSLISYLTASSPVIREEDFHANLYGMNWWTATYAGGHFPRFNGTASNNSAPSSGEIRLKLLLEKLAVVCRNDPNSSDKFYFFRLYYWLRFLNEFIKVTSITPDSESIYTLITELQCALGECEDDNILSNSDPTIFPELANLFGYGCVRPARPILSLNQAMRTWNRSLNDDLCIFIGGLLARKPRYFELLKLLSERSRDSLKPPILPIFRSILYFSLVQNRFETVFQFEPRDQYVASSLPSCVSLTKLIDLPVLLQDFVQVYCCTAARQRRSLPDLIEFWDEKILGKEDLSHLAGNRAICWFKHFRDLLALDLILLYGHLKLLSTPDEEFQAARLIDLIFEKFESEGKGRTVKTKELPGNSQSVVINDFIRWNHRWSLVSKSVGQFPPESRESVPETVISWFRTILQFGRTAFSLPEPDWRDEQFGTPGVGVSCPQVGSVFTMYTTDPSERSE